MLNAVALTASLTQIQNEDGFCATLVTGSAHALLFDTLDGREDLRGFVSALTGLPLTVVNSHGHFDHTGGNGQFGAVYISPKERETLARNRLLRERLNWPLWEQAGQPDVLDLAPGLVFDLGGVSLEAVELPGHTAGSMGLLCREERILLAGDAFTPQMCLFFPESLSLETYRETLEFAGKLPFDRFILGHFTRMFPKTLLDTLSHCAELPERKKGAEFIYSLVPEYRGQAYFLEYNNLDAGGMVCIITK